MTRSTNAPVRVELHDGEVSLQPRDSDDLQAQAFAVRVAGRVVGDARLRRVSEGVARLSWSVDTVGVGPDILTRAVRLMVKHAYAAHGIRRVEAHLDPDGAVDLRAAARAGLRREGVIRAGDLVDGQPRDCVLVAGLASDPEPSSRSGFVAELNARLPRKRLIAHGIIRDQQGRVLLCELTYKPEWDLPGGVIEPAESPRTAVRREVAEELGVDLEPRGLLAVNWLPPWSAWDDACTFLFDLGRHEQELASRMSLQPAEVRAVHWCGPAEVAAHAAAATAVVLRRLWDHDGPPAYLEGGLDPS